MRAARPFLLAVFVALCALWYWKQNVWNVLPTPGLSDFRFYYYAAQHVVHGESPYLTTDYVYPPLLACALAPLAFFDYYTARWIWFVFAHLCFLAAAFLLWRRMGRNWTAAAVIALVWSAGWAAQDGFPTGQPDALLTLLIVVACVGSGWVSGAAAGVGFAVKLIPGVLGILGPLRRNWRMLGAFAASAAVLMAAPWGVVCFLRGPLKPANTDYLFGTPCVLSWSLPSVALRVLEPPGAREKLPNDWINGWDLPRLHLTPQQKAVSLAVAFVTLAAGLALLGLRTRGRIDRDDVPLAGTAVVALAMAASPIAWWHYQAMQYPGVALLLYASIQRRDWRRLSAAVVSALLVFPIPAGVLRYYYHQHGDRWPDAPALLYVWTSVAPVASLLLFGLLLSYIPRFAGQTEPGSLPISGQPAGVVCGWRSRS
jgi:hypothetical protein